MVRRVVQTSKGQAFAKREDSIRYLYVLLFAGLTLAYLALTILPDPQRRVLEQYHLTPASYRLLLYPLVFLLVSSWIMTLIAALKVIGYAKVIKNSKDGRGFKFIGAGIVALSLSQPLNALVSNVITKIEIHLPHLTPTLTIVNNYFNLLWTAITLLLLAWGAEKLLALVKRPTDFLGRDTWTVLFIALSALYTYFLIIQPVRSLEARRAYFLPDWLLIATIALPYMWLWYFGLRGAYKLYLYQISMPGKLYKQALNYLAAGLVVVVVSSVVTRVITTLSSRLSQLSLTPVVLIVYGLVLIYALGFVLIAIGSNKLKKIEEV